MTVDTLAHQELDRAYGKVRSGLVRVLQAQQLDPRSGAAIAQRLGLNRQLAWQLATIAGESSAAAGLAVMPGARGLELFIEASTRQSTDPAPALVELRSAIEGLEGAIRTHAGDRATLALLAATWNSAEVERRTEDLRRDAHRAQCALLGARVDTQVRGIIFAPSRRGDPSRLAMASYQGMSGVTRIRANHRSRLFYLELPTHDDGTVDRSVPDLAGHLREKFQLVPELSGVGEGAIEYIVEGHRSWVTLGPGPVGTQGAINLAFTGLPAYENPRYVTGKDSLNQVAVVTHIPTETLLVDCLMDRALAEAEGFVGSVRMQCFDASTGHPMRPVSTNDPAFLFDLTDTEYLGPEVFAADPAFAGTGALVARAAARAGTVPERLVGVRCRVRYVIAPMSVVVTRELPPAP